MALLAEGLLPATFRGVPFAVEVDSLGGGRRQAMHTYPNRDTSWAEDMGRAPRTYSFRGFITTDDVIFDSGPIQLQRALLLAALEKEGPGILTHPTLGILNVSVGPFNLGQDLGAGRKSSIDISFVESGKQSFPNLLVSGSGILSALAGAASIALDLVAVANAITGQIGGAKAAAGVSAGYAAQVGSAGADATTLINLAAQLPGPNGRYSAGANAGLSGAAASPYADDTTIDALIADAVSQRVAISAGIETVSASSMSLGSAANFNALAAAISALLGALVSACANPADAIRLLLALIDNPPASADAATTAGGTIVMTFQRYACFALAQAVANYQPSSFDDAAQLLSSVAAAIDMVATAAADAGDDSSFEALDALMAAVTVDLRARGAELAPMKTFAVSSPMPDVVLAQLIYRDPMRSDQLLGTVNPIHPLFMPTMFQALAA